MLWEVLMCRTTSLWHAEGGGDAAAGIECLLWSWSDMEGREIT